MDVVLEGQRVSGSGRIAIVIIMIRHVKQPKVGSVRGGTVQKQSAQRTVGTTDVEFEDHGR
jgi:hypothetical protein